jgi:ATP-dependent DNA helicase RecG
MEFKDLKCSPALIQRLTEAGWQDPQSLLYHYPTRYDEVNPLPFSAWNKGDKVVLEGEIIPPIKTMRIRSTLQVSKFLLQSDDNIFQVTIYNRPWISNVKTRLTLFGKYEGDNKITATQYNGQALSSQTGIHPVYALRKEVSQKDIGTLIEKLFMRIESLNIVDVPSRFRNAYRLLPMKQALRMIHQPGDFSEVAIAARTLKYEEFLRFTAKLELLRDEQIGQNFGKSKVFDRRGIADWSQHLPFHLTQAQQEVVDEILDDLQSSKRMYRLLQGDVGSGKTVVAALAMYACVLSHHQAALLVPTEILAQQHLATLKTYLPSSIRIEALYSALGAAQKKDILLRLSKGEIDLIIGTHSLIQTDVKFKNCGLVVADEQHRFGVKQRQALASKGDKVDFLLMSATPIPRTLAAFVFGDLDVSTIRFYHTGKPRIQTEILQGNSIRPILKELLAAIKTKTQIYVVCPAIEEDSELRNVNSVTANLKKYLPKDIHIDQLHGKLSNDEKDKVLKRFLEGSTDLLVCTTVIEVGVSIPNANIMVVYDSDRFGLSQLHQLRGRVGRGTIEGKCFLLSESDDPLTLERLNVLKETEDGFAIANKDLELRGPGEMLGLKQSGVPSFLIANVVKDINILKTAQTDAKEMLKSKDPEILKWIDNLKNSQIGQQVFLD